MGVSDQLERERRQLKLKSTCNLMFAQQPNSKPQRQHCFTTGTPSVRKPKSKAAVPMQPNGKAAVPTKEWWAGRASPAPKATAKPSEPVTELSKLDDRVAMLQRKLTDREEKLHDLLQTSSDSDLRVRKLVRLVARIKKQLSTLNLKRYELRQRKG